MTSSGRRNELWLRFFNSEYTQEELLKCSRISLAPTLQLLNFWEEHYLPRQQNRIHSVEGLTFELLVRLECWLENSFNTWIVLFLLDVTKAEACGCGSLTYDNISIPSQNYRLRQSLLKSSHKHKTFCCNWQNKCVLFCTLNYRSVHTCMT